MGFEKWITGALGWALFGPIGGILGFYFASKLEKMSAAVSAQGGQQAWNQGQRNSFLMSLLVLSASNSENPIMNLETCLMYWTKLLPNGLN